MEVAALAQAERRDVDCETRTIRLSHINAENRRSVFEIPRLRKSGNIGEDVTCVGSYGSNNDSGMRKLE